MSGILWGCPRTSRTSRTPDRVVRTRGPDRPGHTPYNPFRSCDPDTTGHCSRTRVTGHPGHPGHSTKKIQTPAIASSGAINGPSARMSRLYLIIATRGIGLGFVFGAACRAPKGSAAQAGSGARPRGPRVASGASSGEGRAARFVGLMLATRGLWLGFVFGETLPRCPRPSGMGDLGGPCCPRCPSVRGVR